MHYGVIEKFSLKFYQQEISSQTDNPTNQTYHTQGCSLYLEEKLTLSFGLGTVILKSTVLNGFDFKCLRFAHLKLHIVPLFFHRHQFKIFIVCNIPFKE